MSRSILRDGDERGEKIVSEFLDKHFYIECEDFHRVVDKVQQIKGVDTTFVKNGFQYVCDEKAITLMRWIRRSNEDGTLLKISE